MVIRRDAYLQKLIDRMGNGMVKIITGIRRCGKSYLLFEIFRSYLLSQGVDPSHIIALQLDDRANREYLDPDALYRHIRGLIVDEEPYYILLDEVQLVKEFESVLLSLLHIHNADIYATGSNAKFLSSDIITEFRGRGDQVHLSPLSFSEFFAASSLDFEDAWNEYSVYGGMPYLLSCRSVEQKISYLRNLFEETYLKDIVNRYNLRNEDVLEEILNIVSSDIGSLTNPNKLSKTFRSIKNKAIAPETIRQYLDYFVDSFLIRKAHRYDVKGKGYIDTPLKYYFSDMGLRNARLNFRQIEESRAMENIIYNELMIRGFNVDVGVVPIGEKNENGNYVQKQLEVDFVCNLGYERYYIQSALSIDEAEKRELEERPLLRIDDHFRKIVIVRKSISPRKDENGVLFLGLKTFLLEPESIRL